MSRLRTTRQGNVTTIEFSGPFFTKDPELTLAENVDVMLRAMADEGAEDVRAQVSSHAGDMPYSTAWSQSRIAARRNFPWREGHAFSLVWTSTQGFNAKQAIRTMAAMSTIEDRWHPFRMTKNRLLKSRAVNKAELTKGLE